MNEMCSTTSNQYFVMKIALLLTVITCLILFAQATDHRSQRIKRRVVFSKNSKIFYRVNTKENVIPWVQIFAVGWAARVNFDLPDTLQRRHKFFKRDVENEINNLADTPGFKGYSCILSYVCQQVQKLSSSNKCGIFCEIGKIINLSAGPEMEFFTSLYSRCNVFKEICTNSMPIK